MAALLVLRRRLIDEYGSESAADLMPIDVAVMSYLCVPCERCAISGVRHRPASLPGARPRAEGRGGGRRDRGTAPTEREARVRRLAEAPRRVLADGSLDVLLADTPRALREALGLMASSGDRFSARFELPVRGNQLLLTRTHPLVEGLATFAMDTPLAAHGRGAGSTVRGGPHGGRGATLDAATGALLLPHPDPSWRRGAPASGRGLPVARLRGTARQTGWSGAFDVVLGNPLWEKIELSEKAT